MFVEVKSFLQKSIKRLVTHPRKLAMRDSATILDTNFGVSRGTPIDRKLISNFIDNEIPYLINVKQVLEFGDSQFSAKFYSADKITIFKFEENEYIKRVNSNVISGDLLKGVRDLGLGFDLIIATQLLAFTKNPFIAMNSLTELLSEKGVIIGTEPFISPISYYDKVRWGDYFRFTSDGIKILISDALSDRYKIETTELGSWSSTLALIQGLVQEDNLMIDVSSNKSLTSNIGYKISKI